MLKSKKILSLFIGIMLMISSISTTALASAITGEEIEVEFIANDEGIASIAFNLPETEYDRVFIDYYDNNEFQWGFAADISSYDVGDKFTHEAIMGTFTEEFEADTVVISYGNDGDEILYDIQYDDTIALELRYTLYDDLIYYEDLDGQENGFNYDDDYIYLTSDFTSNSSIEKIYFNGDGGEIVGDGIDTPENAFKVNGGVDAENINDYSVVSYQSVISSENYSLSIWALEYSLKQNDIPDEYKAAPTGLSLVKSEYNGIALTWDDSVDPDAVADIYIYFDNNDDYSNSASAGIGNTINFTDALNPDDRNLEVITKIAVEFVGDGYISETAYIDVNVSSDVVIEDTVIAKYESYNNTHFYYEYTNIPESITENSVIYTYILDMQGYSGGRLQSYDAENHTAVFYDYINDETGMWSYGFGQATELETLYQEIVDYSCSEIVDNTAIVTVYKCPIEFDYTDLDLEAAGVQDITFENYLICAETGETVSNIATNNTNPDAEIIYSVDNTGIGQWLLNIDEKTGEITINNDCGNTNEYVVVYATSQANGEYMTTSHCYILLINPEEESEYNPELEAVRAELAKLEDITITAEDYEAVIAQGFADGYVTSDDNHADRFFFYFLTEIMDESLLPDGYMYAIEFTGLTDEYPYESLEIDIFIVEDTWESDDYMGELEKFLTFTVTGTGIPSGVETDEYVNLEEIDFSTSLDTVIPSTVFTQEELDACGEMGVDPKVELTVNKVTEITETEQIAIETLTTDLKDDYTVGMILDINFTKYIGETSSKVTDLLGEEIEITIDIPEDMQGKELVIIRVHNNVAEILKDIDESDTTFTFKTDVFSTYALAEVTAADTESTDVPQTGDSNAVPFILAIMAVAFMGVMATGKKKLVEE